MDSKKCEEFWKMADKDGNGELTIGELKVALGYSGCQMSDSAIANMFIDIDRDGDKKISKKEFIDEMLNLPAKAAELKRLFKQFDANNDGSLSRDECRKLILSSKHGYSEQQADNIIKEADKNGDGNISFVEFEKACQ